MEKEIKKIIHIEKRLCVKDTLINSLPTFIGGGMWIIITIQGIKILQNTFSDEWLAIALIIWLLICLDLVKRMIPFSKTTYSVKEYSYDDEK